MKIVTLMENTVSGEQFRCAHGLSLYIETPKHKILFDMGPDSDFIANAETAGVDLKAVDIAFLSHGHFDHGGGLMAFLELNDHAKVYLRESAFGQYYILKPDLPPKYIGIDPAIPRDRLVFTADEQTIDEELSLFSVVPDTVGALASSFMLKEKTAEGFIPDLFPHEQDLVIRAEGKTVLMAGCAHRGIVNILNTARKHLGYAPDATFGGFHLFQLTEGDPAADKLIDSTGRALLAGNTVYYSGHCTGEYAFDRLKTILGDRLQRINAGCVTEL